MSPFKASSRDGASSRFDMFLLKCNYSWAATLIRQVIYWGVLQRITYWWLRNLPVGRHNGFFFFFLSLGDCQHHAILSLGEIKHMGEISVYCQFMFHGRMSVLLKYLEHDDCPLIHDCICVHISLHGRISVLLRYSFSCQNFYMGQ